MSTQLLCAYLSYHPACRCGREHELAHTSLWSWMCRSRMALVTNHCCALFSHTWHTLHRQCPCPCGHAHDALMSVCVCVCVCGHGYALLALMLPARECRSTAADDQPQAPPSDRALQAAEFLQVAFSLLCTPKSNVVRKLCRSSDMWKSPRTRPLISSPLPRCRL
jgi:hypothetical protein